MSFIKMPGLGDAQEQPLPPEGLYDLVITDAQLREKDGRSSIMCILKIENTEEDYASLFHHIGLPNSEDEPDKAKAKNLFAKRFFMQFSIPIEAGGFDIETLVGCRARDVKVKTSEFEGKPTRNVEIDRLPEEGEL